MNINVALQVPLNTACQTRVTARQPHTMSDPLCNHLQLSQLPDHQAGAGHQLMAGNSRLGLPGKHPAGVNITLDLLHPG